MHSFVISKNVKWCHLIWPTLYIASQLGVWTFALIHRVRRFLLNK